MFTGNFRVLIFIDLLATALGGSLILMMVLSTNKGKSAPPAGSARNFIFYQVFAEDPDVRLKLIVQNGDNKKWFETTLEEMADSTSGTFLINEKEQDVFAWGPVIEFDTANNIVTSKNGITMKKVFNVYSTSQKQGVWTLGALYYNNRKLDNSDLSVIDKQVKLHHHLQTLDGTIYEDTTTLVSLGNYSFISYTIKPDFK